MAGARRGGRILINLLETKDGYVDLAAAMTVELDAVLKPKVGDPAQVVWLEQEVKRLETAIGL